MKNNSNPILESVCKFIATLVFRFIGIALLTSAYNHIAPEFNLPTFSMGLFVAIVWGLRFCFYSTSRD